MIEIDVKKNEKGEEDAPKKSAARGRAGVLTDSRRVNESPGDVHSGKINAAKATQKKGDR